MLTHNGSAYRRVENSADAIEFSEDSPSSSLELKIMQMGKDTLSVQVAPQSSVAQLKRQVFGEDLDKGKNVRMIFAGKLLRDQELINDCGLKDGSFIQVSITDAIAVQSQPVEDNDAQQAVEIPPELYYEQNYVENNEGHNAEFLLGLSLGFMLGFIVLIILWQPRASRKQKLGVLVGVFLHIFLSYNDERARQEKKLQEQQESLTAAPTLPASNPFGN